MPLRNVLAFLIGAKIGDGVRAHGCARSCGCLILLAVIFILLVAYLPDLLT